MSQSKIFLITTKPVLLAWAFFCLGFFTVTWDRLAVVPVMGFHIKLNYAFFSLAFITAAWSSRKNLLQKISQFLLRDYPVFILLLVIYFLAMLPRSYFPLKTFLYSGWLMFELLAVWLTARMLASYIPLRWIYILIAVTLVCLSLVIFIDQVAFSYGYNGGYLGFNQAKDLGWKFSRPAAFSYEPSYVANFLCMGILFILPVFMHKGRSRLYFLGVIAFTIFALICTTSRTGWFGLAVGIGLFLTLLAYQTKKIPWKILGLIAAFVGISVFIFYLFYNAEQAIILDQLLVSSLFNGTDGSGVSRLKSFLHSVTMAKETQWLGTGLGASFWYWATLHVPQVLNNNFNLTPDRYGMESMMSTWAQLLAEGGIPATLLFACFVFLFIKALLKNWKKTGQVYALGALVGAVVFFLFSAHFISNISRGDVWVWYALWTMSLYSPTDEKSLG